MHIAICTLQYAHCNMHIALCTLYYAHFYFMKYLKSFFNKPLKTWFKKNLKASLKKSLKTSFKKSLKHTWKICMWIRTPGAGPPWWAGSSCANFPNQPFVQHFHQNFQILGKSMPAHAQRAGFCPIFGLNYLDLGEIETSPRTKGWHWKLVN